MGLIKHRTHNNNKNHGKCYIGNTTNNDSNHSHIVQGLPVVRLGFTLPELGHSGAVETKMVRSGIPQLEPKKSLIPKAKCVGRQIDAWAQETLKKNCATSEWPLVKPGVSRHFLTSVTILLNTTFSSNASYV